MTWLTVTSVVSRTVDEPECVTVPTLAAPGGIITSQGKGLGLEVLGFKFYLQKLQELSIGVIAKRGKSDARVCIVVTLHGSPGLSSEQARNNMH